MQIVEKIQSVKGRVLTGTGLVLASGFAMASETGGTSVDVSGAVSTLTTEGGAAIAAVGGAMLTLAGIAVSFKWAKAAFFG